MVKTSGTINIKSSYTLGCVDGNNKYGSFIGGVVNTNDNTSFGTLNITNCQSRVQDMSKIGGVEF